eukprot:6202727-Pleurochrysis_carterae.AAC.3
MHAPTRARARPHTRTPPPHRSYEAATGKRLASLVAPTAFAFGAEILGDYEYAGFGVTTDNWGEGDYSFQTCLQMLFIDCLLYTVRMCVGLSRSLAPSHPRPSHRERGGGGGRRVQKLAIKASFQGVCVKIFTSSFNLLLLWDGRLILTAPLLV